MTRRAKAESNKRLIGLSSWYSRGVVMQFECGTRILRVIHGRDARATPSNCTTTRTDNYLDMPTGHLYLIATSFNQSLSGARKWITLMKMFLRALISSKKLR